MGHWKEVQHDSPGLPAEPPERLTSLDDIEGWWIDESYFLDKDTSSVHSAHRISTWLRSSCFVHPITDTIFGGPYGIKWAVLVLIRMHCTMAALAQNQRHPYRKRYRPSRHQTALLEADTRWILEALLNSVGTIDRYASTSIQPLNIRPPPIHSFQRAERLLDDESEVSVLLHHCNLSDCLIERDAR